MKPSPILVAASLLVAACGTSRPPDPNVAALAKAAAEPRPMPAPMPAMGLAAATGSEIRIRLDQDLGPGVSPPNDLFTARLVAPLLDRRGIVLVPVGALVHGRVVHVDEEQHRVELVFERLETRDGVYQIRAIVIAATPYALTVAPPGSTPSETVVLQGFAPSAIGGGPPAPESEPDEDTPRGVAIVPFDAELRLKLMGPIVQVKE